MSRSSSPSNRDEEIDKIKNDIDTLKSDVSEIKSMLQQMMAKDTKSINSDFPINTFAAAEDDYDYNVDKAGSVQTVLSEEQSCESETDGIMFSTSVASLGVSNSATDNYYPETREATQQEVYTVNEDEVERGDSYQVCSPQVITNDNHFEFINISGKCVIQNIPSTQSKPQLQLFHLHFTYAFFKISREIYSIFMVLLVAIFNDGFYWRSPLSWKDVYKDIIIITI